jgi:hypothetical protein
MQSPLPISTRSTRQATPISQSRGSKEVCQNILILTTTSTANGSPQATRKTPFPIHDGSRPRGGNGQSHFERQERRWQGGTSNYEEKSHWVKFDSNPPHLSDILSSPRFHTLSPAKHLARAPPVPRRHYSSSSGSSSLLFPIGLSNCTTAYLKEC